MCKDYLLVRRPFQQEKINDKMLYKKKSWFRIIIKINAHQFFFANKLKTFFHIKFKRIKMWIFVCVKTQVRLMLLVRE